MCTDHLLRRPVSRWLKSLPLLALVAVWGLPAQAAEKKPNILFIMGDDIGWMQVGAYQNGLSFNDTTPNIDRIANEGAKMMTYYAEQSCTAGRNAFFTGMTPLRTGMIAPQLPRPPPKRLKGVSISSRCSLFRLVQNYRPALRCHRRRHWLHVA